mmetsp:Transcript_35335/g.51590  ORF Transcript_35335/g.51590 Transcript_35335/m.51590 type:complete len:90 (+) Transcript_35335:1070-1339(+)
MQSAGIRERCVADCVQCCRLISEWRRTDELMGSAMAVLCGGVDALCGGTHRSERSRSSCTIGEAGGGHGGCGVLLSKRWHCYLRGYFHV